MAVDLKEIALKLRLLREQAGLSQGDLAKMAGITQGQISNYEVGRAFPGLESLVALVNALGTTITEILSESKPATAPPRRATKYEMALWVIEEIGIDGFQLDRIKAALSGNLQKF